MARLGKEVPSLLDAKRTWKFDGDEVILEYIRYWFLDATKAGLSNFRIIFNEAKGTYFCSATA